MKLELLVTIIVLNAYAGIHAASVIVEPNFNGVIGITVFFTTDPLLPPPNSPWDDGNILTHSDTITGYRFSLPNGIIRPGVSFSLQSSDPDYAIAFPTPGTYQVDLYRDLSAILTSNGSTVLDTSLLDTREITLTAIPEPGLLGLIGFGAFACLVLRRRNLTG